MYLCSALQSYKREREIERERDVPVLCPSEVVVREREREIERERCTCALPFRGSYKSDTNRLALTLVVTGRRRLKVHPH
jgi:hypothetical protein